MTNSNTLQDRVVACIARTTRYPSHLLTPTADLENELGIDSVKQAEVMTALGREFGFELGQGSESPLRTIGDVCAWVAQKIGGANSVAVSRRADDASSRVPVVAPKSETTFTRAQSVAAASSAVQTAATSTMRPPAPHRAPFPNGVQPHRPNSAASRVEIDTPISVRVELSKSSERSSLANAGTSNATRVGGSSKRSDDYRPLEGKVALVTGSARGLGRTTVELLASQGARVVVNSFHSRDEGDQTVAQLRERGCDARHVWGSIAQESQVESIFTEIDREFGGIDILVCNASDGKIGPFDQLHFEDWDRAFRTNVAGHHACAMQARRRMQARGGGAIVTMSAIGAHRYVDGLGCQGVAKAAVEALTRYLACEFAPDGIRVNCVAAGPVYGELLAKFPEARSSQHHWESMTPGGRLVTPLDVAQVIAFLVGDGAKAINGAVWPVDAGFSAHADSRFQNHGLAPASLVRSGGVGVR